MNIILKVAYVTLFLAFIYSCDDKDDIKPENNSPNISELIVNSLEIDPLDTCMLVCIANDPDKDVLEITWESEYGNFLDGNRGDTVYWIAPNEGGYPKIKVNVSDGITSVTELVTIHVFDESITRASFELGNSGIYVEMIKIPAGSFLMGNPGTTDAGSDEYPQHEVTIDYEFWIGKFEITQEQWEAVFEGWDFGFEGKPNRPAENISWNDVQAFINSINKNEMGDLWRLPSEAEWEYVAKAGGNGPGFWWGEDFDYSEIGNYAWINMNSVETHNVGTTMGGISNPLGIWDLEGNVWEWCQDWYQPNYSGAPEDGSAWEKSGTQRVIRGSSFYQGARQCLPNLRSMLEPHIKYNNVGFRLVRKI